MCQRGWSLAGPGEQAGTEAADWGKGEGREGLRWHLAAGQTHGRGAEGAYAEMGAATLVGSACNDKNWHRTPSSGAQPRGGRSRATSELQAPASGSCKEESAGRQALWSRKGGGISACPPRTPERGGGSSGLQRRGRTPWGPAAMARARGGPGRGCRGARGGACVRRGAEPPGSHLAGAGRGGGGAGGGRALEGDERHGGGGAAEPAAPPAPAPPTRRPAARPAPPPDAPPQPKPKPPAPPQLRAAAALRAPLPASWPRLSPPWSARRGSCNPSTGGENLRSSRRAQTRSGGAGNAASAAGLLSDGDREGGGRGPCPEELPLRRVCARLGKCEAATPRAEPAPGVRSLAARQQSALARPLPSGDRAPASPAGAGAARWAGASPWSLGGVRTPCPAGSPRIAEFARGAGHNPTACAWTSSRGIARSDSEGRLPRALHQRGARQSLPGSPRRRGGSTSSLAPPPPTPPVEAPR